MRPPEVMFCLVRAFTTCPVLQAGPSVPKGLATLSDGSMDTDYYTVNQGIHADFVAGLNAIMAGASHDIVLTVLCWANVKGLLSSRILGWVLLLPTE